MTHGNIKTPKSILFLYAIKSLTNNTELINTTDKYGHEISYTILEELDTEYALLQLNRHEETGGLVLSEGCKERELAIVVANNIDRNEETLSGV